MASIDYAIQQSIPRGNGLRICCPEQNVWLRFFDEKMCELHFYKKHGAHSNLHFEAILAGNALFKLPALGAPRVAGRAPCAAVEVVARRTGVHTGGLFEVVVCATCAASLYNLNFKVKWFITYLTMCLETPQIIT